MLFVFIINITFIHFLQQNYKKFTIQIFCLNFEMSSIFMENSRESKLFKGILLKNLYIGSLDKTFSLIVDMLIIEFDKCKYKKQNHYEEIKCPYLQYTAL